jgi:hypothetical protein
MSDQIEMFKEYISKLKGLVGEERTNFILAKSLFVVVAGSDDIANTYFVAHARELQYDIPTYTDLMVTNAVKFLKVRNLSSCQYIPLLFHTSVREIN